MELNKASVQKLLEAGVHFGHQSKRWNPKMKKYIYTEKNGVHIIDVTKTVTCLNDALEFIKNSASKGDIIFVGTKKQAQGIIKDAAKRAGAYYIINRWPGGLLTNHSVIRLSLNKINDLVKSFEEGIENRTKKELILMKRELSRLDRLYGGLRTFNRKPAAIFVVDPKTESIAIREARKTGIPIIAMVDTNSDPDSVDKIIPANDDASKSINLIVNMIADAVLEGNGGKGVKHEDIDFTTVDQSISDMSVKVAAKEEKDEEVESDILYEDEEDNKPKTFRVKKVEEKPDEKVKKPRAKKAA